MVICGIGSRSRAHVHVHACGTYMYIPGIEETLLEIWCQLYLVVPSLVEALSRSTFRTLVLNVKRSKLSSQAIANLRAPHDRSSNMNGLTAIQTVAYILSAILIVTELVSVGEALPGELGKQVR